MTTTSSFQKKPDYYPTKHECEKSKYTKYQTNPRYRNFNQTHFTAGDEEQFQEYRDATNGSVCIPEISLNENIFNETNIFEKWTGYKSLEATSVLNTFRYIFNKFKKGIFVKIIDNNLSVFLPFSKHKFVNEWSDRIKVDIRKHGDIRAFIGHISRMEGRKGKPRVNDFVNTWYANNCLVRYEYPVVEGDSNISTMKNMLETLCAKRVVPDMEFFMNRRDFPILTRGGFEPYYNLWDSRTKKLVSHAYKQYSPILSMSVTDEYADVLMPTYDDWDRVQSDKWFLPGCRDMSDEFNMPWSSKKSIAVFRGSSTGCGTTSQTNNRLKIAEMSQTSNIIDAGITKWNLRPRKLMGEKYLQTIVKNDAFSAKPLTIQEQSEYKYIVNIDGHVKAFRLSIELATGSVVLLVDSPWKIWYSHLLEPYKHFVPVKSDLSDLVDQINWCITHDKECEQISKHAREFYDTYLQEKGVLDYLQKIFIDLKNETGVYLYNTITPLDSQIETEYSALMTPKFPETEKTERDISVIPKMGRNISLLKGMEWIVNMIHKPGFESIATEGAELFKNKLGSVRYFELAKFPFAIKTTSDDKKTKEHIHEAFIGTMAINEVIKKIPNFMYIFGLYNEDRRGSVNVVTEYIHGITLFEYIKSKDFKFSEYLFIIAQISLALQVAQNTCGFVHYDLTPWNIILQRTTFPQVFDYVINYETIIRVKTDVIPIIIDYGKSHVVHDNTHYGFINMYKTSTIQDIITLLLTSVNQIKTDRKLSLDGIKDLLKLSNFISGTGYRKQKFSSFKDLQEFLTNEKNYSRIIVSDKHELEDKTPLDFIKYIDTNFPGVTNMKQVQEYIPKMNTGNARQIFDYVLSGNFDERLESYYNVFRRIKHCSIPIPKNELFSYYCAQNLNDSLQSVLSDLDRFLAVNNKRPAIALIVNPEVDAYSKYLKIGKETIEYIHGIYNLDGVGKDKLNYSIKSDYSSLKVAHYDETTFLVPSEILPLISPLSDDMLHYYKDTIESILLNNGKYKLPHKIKTFYIQQFDKLLKIKGVNLLNNVANIKTVREMSAKLYTQDMENLRQEVADELAADGEGDNCKDADRTIKLYTEILDKVVRIDGAPKLRKKGDKWMAEFLPEKLQVADPLNTLLKKLPIALQQHVVKKYIDDRYFSNTVSLEQLLFDLETKRPLREVTQEELDTAAKHQKEYEEDEKRQIEAYDHRDKYDLEYGEEDFDLYEDL